MPTAKKKKPTRTKMKIKRGDQVRVISGKHKGAEGKIVATFAETNRVVVENVNVVKKTQKPTQQNPRGGFRDQELPIHASNVMILDPKSGEPTRIRYGVNDAGDKIRVAVKSGVEIDRK